jgi:YD repeat-containing protein
MIDRIEELLFVPTMTTSTHLTTASYRSVLCWRRIWALGTLRVGLVAALVHAQTPRPVTEYSYNALGNLTTTTALLGRTISSYRIVRQKARGVVGQTVDLRYPPGPLSHARWGWRPDGSGETL